MNEGDPGIVGLQPGNDVFIKNEDGQYGERSVQGFLQPAVVFQAQVPSEPETEIVCIILSLENSFKDKHQSR